MPDLIGRDQELELIASFLEQAAAGGGTLLFTGEPGIGKTALLDAAAESALAAGLEVFRTAGSEFGSEVSFSGLARLLQPLSADLASLSSLHRRSLAAIAGDAGQPQPERLAVFQAALALLGQAARRGPLLAIVDDLQWLDLHSASALGFVARRLAGLRVGFLAVSRSGAESFSERAGLASRELRPLDADSAAALLGARFPELALPVRQRLLAEAHGNPLALLELPALLSGPQRTALAPLPSVLPLGRRLQALFAAQAGELPGRARRMLLFAALDGTGDLHVLRAAGESWAADLAPAEQARLVSIEEGTGRLAFRHPLIRSAVVGLASDADRRQAHRALAEQFADRPERRAWHLSEAAAGPDEPVAVMLEAAAAQVLRRGDAAGAVSALLRAAELSPARPDRSRRLAYAALVSASVTMEVSTVAPLLGDARQAGPEPGTSLLAAATTAFMLLNGDGDVITAHRLITQAVEDQSGPGSKGPTGIFEAISTLFILSAFAARPELWAAFHAVVRTGRHAEAAAHVRAMREADLGAISPRLALIVAGAAALAAPASQARGLFETALATRGADQWPFDLARIRLLYGEWLRRERSTADARVQLSLAMNAFRQLSALPWQIRAANELRATGLAAPDGDPAWPRTADAPGMPEAAGLTPLDRQIADLAAAGLTNKQIGERLYLSHRTVAAHLYQIFPRLGITSRAALRDALDALDGSGHAQLPAAVR
jgi:DNA-binding CsgD family transcriptional regulator